MPFPAIVAAAVGVEEGLMVQRDEICGGGPIEVGVGGVDRFVAVEYLLVDG